MPIKLLAKKSWHVYNADNVARVRRDEAEARAREADEERQQRAAESSRRAAQLRGEALGDSGDSAEQAKWAAAERATNQQSTEATPAVPVVSARASTRRPRKRHGEDDTDFEMRMAKAHVEEEESVPAGRRQKTSAAAEKEQPLVDGRGNIDLFGQLEEGAVARAARPAGPTPDAPPSSMRFADAAGGANALSAWYAGEKGPTPASKPTFSSTQSSSNWPRRPPISAPAGSLGADPLAVMRQGAAAVRALKQERQRETDERNRAMAAMVVDHEREQARDRHRHHRRREHHHRDHHRDDKRRRGEDGDKEEVDSLDGFALDDVKEKDRDDRDTKERRRHSYRDRRDDRDDRHSKTRDHDDRGRRHHRDDKDRERSRHRHHRDRDGRSRSYRETARSKERSSLSPMSRASA